VAGPLDPKFSLKRNSGGPVFPNTNKHATEGSNPVWLTGAAYDNVTFGFDDDLDSRYVLIRQTLLFVERRVHSSPPPPKMENIL
jgi:hypothetical protein